MTATVLNRYLLSSIVITIIVFMFASLSTQVFAAGNDYESTNNYGKSIAINNAQKSLNLKNYNQAIRILKKEVSYLPKNADALNLLGFSYRKLKDYDNALSYYLEALGIEPRHRGANNYLGHLYLETGELEKAKQRLAVLDKSCVFSCKEFRDLKKAIKSYNP